MLLSQSEGECAGVGAAMATRVVAVAVGHLANS